MHERIVMAEEQKQRPKAIRLLSCLLRRIAESNDRRGLQSSSAFHGLTAPLISIERCLDRIFKYANCSHACYIVAYIYLHRLMRHRHDHQLEFQIDSFSVHRLLITAVMVSAKFLDDMHYNNAQYAKIGGIATNEINILEVDFLFGLGFELNVTPSTFHTYSACLNAQLLILDKNNIGLSEDEQELHS